MLTVKTFDCVATVVLLSISVVANILLRNFSPEVILAINTDSSLLLAHLLILTNRVPYLMKISMNGCSAVAMFCQWFITAHFSFMFFEALQTYAILTGVIHNGFYFPLLPTMIFGWGFTLLITGLTSAGNFKDLQTGWSCIVNYNSTVACGIVLPISIFSWLTVIAIDAASADNRDYKKLLNVSRSQFFSGTLALISILIYSLASFSSYILTSLALFTIDEYLFSIAIILNTVVAATVLFFRVLQNSKVRSFFRKCQSKQADLKTQLFNKNLS